MSKNQRGDFSKATAVLTHFLKTYTKSSSSFIDYWLLSTNNFMSLPSPWKQMNPDCCLLWTKSILIVFGRFGLFLTFLTTHVKSSIFLFSVISYPDTWGVLNILSLSYSLDKPGSKQLPPIKITLFNAFGCFWLFLTIYSLYLFVAKIVSWSCNGSIHKEAGWFHVKCPKKHDNFFLVLDFESQKY